MVYIISRIIISYDWDFCDSAVYKYNSKTHKVVKIVPYFITGGFLGGTNKESACQCRRHKNTGLIPGLGRLPGGRNGNPLQYSYLENPMDRGAWWATVNGVAKTWTQLSTHACTINCTSFSTQYMGSFDFFKKHNNYISHKSLIKTQAQSSNMNCLKII